MGRGRFDLVVTLLLLLFLTTTALSGLLADALGTPRSLYHRYSVYPLVVLACVHIVLKRRQLVFRFKTALAWRAKAGTALKSDRTAPYPSLSPERLSRRGFLLSGVAAVAGFMAGRWLPFQRIPSELEGRDLGQVYHQWSKPSLWGIVRRPFQWGARPALYKEYPAARRIELPRGFGYRGLTVEETIQRRRSLREYTGQPLSLEQLSLLLHSAHGITEPSYPLRASPSAGAQYPLEVYPVVNNVTGLDRGVYHYQPRDHSLRLLERGDFRSSLLIYTVGQDMVLDASVVLVITAVFQLTRWRYKDRAYRYVLLDAGHLGENLYLAATSLNLGPCGIGAFLDDEVNRMVGVDGSEEAAVYLMAIGTPG